MKIRPIILCGGSGTRLWPKSENNQAKQFINFGGWTLIEKTFERIKAPIFDYPIISTNLKYLSIVKKYLKKSKINKYKIVLEPSKQNTAPAILSAILIKDVPNKQPLVVLPADHLVDKSTIFNKIVIKNIKNLTDKNIFIFGIKPISPSSEYGYFLTKRVNGNINKVIKFIEKPHKTKAKKIIKKKGFWNSGMFFARKDSLINNYKSLQPLIYKSCRSSVLHSKEKKNIYFLSKKYFIKAKPKSFDYAILEKGKEINSIKLNIPWTDLGSWREISKIYNKYKNKYFKKKNIFHRPWGNYVNLYKGKNFLVKELTVNPKSSISLQKHHKRSEHWMITQGRPKITINNKKFFKKPNESVFIPLGYKHRIENKFKQPVKIIEVQTGTVLKETDIVRYSDVYGRVS